MSKKIIGVDVDGVLADFNRSFIELVVEETCRDLLPPRPFDIPVWNYPQYYGYTDSEVARVWEIIEQHPSFWARLSPYTDIFDSSIYLRDAMAAGHDVYFVTSRPGLTSKRQTETWLWQQGFPNPTVLISSAKAAIAGALKFDAYIDDRWENAVGVAGTNTKSVLLNRPWNAGYNAAAFGVIRTDTLVGFADLPVAETPTTA